MLFAVKTSETVQALALDLHTVAWQSSNTAIISDLVKCATVIIARSFSSWVNVWAIWEVRSYNSRYRWEKWILLGQNIEGNTTV